MATGLDVAAGALGIVGVAGQLASAIIKIRNFCKEVKNAPEELLETIASVENFSRILTRLGEGQTRDLDDMKHGDVLLECLSMSKKATNRLASFAMELQLEMQRRKTRIAIKTVLNQRTIDRMIDKLDRSKTDLHIAITMFDAVCTRQSLDMIKRHIEEQQKEQMYTISSRSAVVQNQGTTNDDTLPLTRQREDTRWRRQASHTEEWLHKTQIRLPLWLCRYAWDVALIHACGQWTFSFKSFKVIQWDHPAYAMATEDDIMGIRTLLERKELSVHDALPHGKSLLDHSIEWNSPGVVQLLVQAGAFPGNGYQHVWKSGARFQAAPRSRNNSAQFLEAARHMAGLVLNAMQGDIPLLLEAMSKAVGCWTADEKLELLDCIWTRAGVHASFFFDILGTEKIGGTISSLYWHGKNVLHMLAENYQVSYLDAGSRDKWIVSVQHHMTDPNLLHGRFMQTPSNAEITPFANFLQSVFDETRSSDRRVQILIQVWARCASEAGVDLLSYGRAEHQLIRAQPRLHEWLKETGAFLDFTYGSDPEDWHVWLKHPGDLYAGMFWRLVESEKQQIPGAWIEEKEEEVPRFDLWRQGYGGRRIGIKRRVLRRLRTISKAEGVVDADTAEIVNELVNCVQEDVADYQEGHKDGSWDRDKRGRSWARDKRMHGLARSLGVTGPGFRCS